MAGLGIGVKEFKAAFFDSAGVKSRVDAATRKALSKAGAFVRTRARSSIRTRKAVSAPGSPPSSHVGTLKRLIFFAYDAKTRSVVIGPAAFGDGAAPGLLEFGGVGSRKTKSGRKRLVYRARPFMKPAGDAEAPKLRDTLRNMVR